MIIRKNQIFNLFNTNGRRNDVINALQGYLTILDELQTDENSHWEKLPQSNIQFKFYEKAIALSPEVFSRHKNYDDLLLELENEPELKNAIENNNSDWLKKNYKNYSKISNSIDLYVEARARHYTSNLVKLGFTDKNRNITNVGKVLLGKLPLNKDKLESLLPLSDFNIIYLRQMLKLRIFDKKSNNYYSPFLMALYLLLKKDRITQNDFFEVVQGLNPASKINDYSEFIENYSSGDIIKNYEIEIPDELLDKNKIPSEIFFKYFKNKKSKKAVHTYFDFYNALYDFLENKTQSNLNILLDIYERDRSLLNKAFGNGNNIFKNRRGTRPTPEKFLKQEKSNLLKENLNDELYLKYSQSKLIDSIKEYSDTTKRIFKATGLISFNNGYAELIDKELCSYIFNEDIIQQKVFGNIALDDFISISDYEDNINSIFTSNYPISKILNYSDFHIDEILNSIELNFVENSKRKRRKEFEKFIAINFPESKVKEILSLFLDRKNDSKIKKMVNPDASVPTIF